MSRQKAAAGLLAVVGSASSQPLPAQHAHAGHPVSFVACPEFRNTARQCWTAESGGKTYYIGGFGIGTPPQLLHRALIEGVAYDGESSCGATVLDPVHISPLPEIDAACETVLPDNGVGPKELSIFDLPPAVLAANGAAIPTPPPLARDATFKIYFDFDSAHLNLFNQATVETIARTIMSSRVRSINITGFSGRTRLSDGSSMIESPSTGRLRAQAVRDALVLIGVDPNLVRLSNVEKTPVDAQVDGAESRNVAVDIALANGTEYGLSGSVHTSSLERGLRVARVIRAGMVHVNDRTVFDLPGILTGGMGSSGSGSRFGSTTNWDEFTEWQWVTVGAVPVRYPS